jgi:ABC-type dipeptide/oligopeptide/nickel transport system permease component
MLNYIVRRLLLIVPTLIGISMVVFLTMRLSPGGVGANLLSEEGAMRPEEREARRRYLNQRFGLDRPIHVQYARWLNNVSPVGFQYDSEGHRTGFGFKMPDLGRSFVRERPVVDMVAEALPTTVLLNVITIPLVYAIAITTGVYAARHRGKLLDVGTGTVLLALWSIPTIWAGVMLIGYLANRDYIKLFPTGGLHSTGAHVMPFLPTFDTAGRFVHGWLLDSLWHLVLPVVTMTYAGFAFMSKVMRASVLDSLSADFVRTARAKGVSDPIVLFRHVLRNSIIPLITMAAGILPQLLGGSIIIESIYSLNGMGRLMLDAIYQRDSEVVLSITFVASLISLVSVLIADVCYTIADPRVTYD